MRTFTSEIADARITVGRGGRCVDDNAHASSLV
jgi:hypothetical protein